MYILHAFTRELGWVSFLHRAGGRQKTRALLQAMTLVELDFDFKESKDLQQCRQLALSQSFPRVSSEVPRMAVALFMAEVLRKALHKNYINESLFEACEGLMADLDAQDDFSMAPIEFLIALTRAMGFEISPPEVESFLKFDPEEGAFIEEGNGHHALLDEEASALLVDLLRNTSKQARSVPNSAQRRAILRSLLSFVKIHLGIKQNIQSHEILEMVLHS